MQINGDSVLFTQRDLPQLQSGQLRPPERLIASGRTRWEMDLPDGSKVIIREEAHSLGPNIP